MSTECFPIATLPHTTQLFRDYLAMGEMPHAELSGTPLQSFYGAPPLSRAWMHNPHPVSHAAALADALETQARTFAAGPATFANIALLRSGARAVVTGQQVALFGGPLLTLLKAATAVARAKQASAATGVPHVPIFWLATEDHDLEEVNQVALLTKTSVETLRLPAQPAHNAAPVGNVPFGPAITTLVDQAAELLAYAPIADLLRECYQPSATFASAFARLLTRLFADHGLIVLDASGRDFHTLGAPALRHAITHAAELESALLARSAQLASLGYHAQVLVKPGASLLFLLNESSDPAVPPSRQSLRRLPDGSWKAGSGKAGAGNSSAAKSTYSSAELLDILDSTPERLSPNALLRPVFQDTILPTSTYIGGPAEVAYFAQSAVLYQAMLNRITPILPRLTATLLEPPIAALMAQHELSVPDIFTTPEDLAQRLGARALPIAAKRRLASAGNALDEALTAAADYLAELDPNLARSAQVSASKMRYQMNRMRRLAASSELQRETSLGKHAAALTLHLFPHAHPQERLVAGIHFLAQREDLIDLLVAQAANQCPGHLVIPI